MTEVFEHNPGDHEDPRAAPTWVIGVLGAVSLVISLLGLTALYYNEKADKVLVQVLAPERLEPLELQRQQEALLGGPPRWIDRDDQGETVRAYVISIERAMEIVVEESAAEAGRRSR